MHAFRLTKKELQFTVVFAIIVLIELVCGSINELFHFHLIAKPAIVISLIIAFLSFSKSLDKTIKRKVLLGLVFSVIGDIVLMMVNEWPITFTIGLVAFLVAHIFYSSAFWKQRNPQKSPWPIVLPLFGYALALFYLLKDYLADMMIPVLLYMIVILTMATLAFLRRKFQDPKGYWLVFAGAFLFLISDSLLAINKFLSPIPMSHVSIMATYSLAQYAIVFGILKSKL